MATTNHLTPDELRKAALNIIEECRNNLKNGTLDMSRVESSVRTYCESISRLPEEEGQTHREGLRELMRLVTTLGEELTRARDSVKAQLGTLENMRKAHTAYKSTEGIGTKKGPAGNGQ